MSITKEHLEQLNQQSVNFQTAKFFADFITNDNTAGGIINDDGETINEPKFKEKWCPFWPILRAVLQIAKIFTDDKVDKIMDILIVGGDAVCNQNEDKKE